DPGARGRPDAGGDQRAACRVSAGLRRGRPNLHMYANHPAINPPSTNTSEPVVNEEALERSQTTVLATSEGWPRRPMGIWAWSLARALAGSGRVLIMASTMSPSMKAGCTELQRTGGRLRAPERATDLVSRRTAPFDAL